MLSKISKDKYRETFIDHFEPDYSFDYYLSHQMLPKSSNDNYIELQGMGL